MSTAKRPASRSLSPSPDTKKGRGDNFNTDEDAGDSEDVRSVEDTKASGDAEAIGEAVAVSGGSDDEEEEDEEGDEEEEEEEEEKADFEYRGLLYFAGEERELHDSEDDGLDDGHFEFYYEKPSFWDSEDYYTIEWDTMGEERFNEHASSSPMTPRATSPPPIPATVLTLEQLRFPNRHNPSPRSSEAESATVATASSRSPAPSATPPPSPTTAYLRLSWPADRRWQALLTCEIPGPNGDPTNFRVRRLCHAFDGNIHFEAVEAYFEDRAREEDRILDDNNNAFLVGYICWDANPHDSVKIYGKRVVGNYFRTELGEAERQRIVISEYQRGLRLECGTGVGRDNSGDDLDEAATSDDD